jgi:cell division protease FtsH
MEMLVGMWAAKVRELFKKAKAASPAIIFIDEIDSIGKKRWWGMTWGHQEQEQTLNQILTEMDGFDKETNIIVIAATNRPDTLDSALMRSGRFDRKVMVGRPTLEERQLILDYHAKDKKMDKNIDMKSLARRTSSMVWADLSNILNEAALKAAKENRKKIVEKDLEYALEKIVMWPEKKIKSLKEKERNIVTYHELGHAVTAYYLEHADPVEKISIVSRGQALWVTWMMPEEDSYLSSKAKFLDEMVTLLWWRAAEEIFFGKDHITTGASNDFERVTKIARGMMTRYGMDEELWTLVYTDDNEYSAYKPFSEKTAELIDHKVKKIVAEAYVKAIQLVKENKALMESMAELLLEREYISREEFELMMKDPKKIKEKVEEIRKRK